MTAPWHWQDSPFDPPPAARIDRTLADALLDLAETHPHATAVIHDGRRTSVAELAGRVGGLARMIAAAAAPPGPVALIQSAGVDAVAAWFACAVAGRPLLLLEPHNPPGRNAELIALAGAPLILHDAAVRHAMPERLDGVIAIRPDGGTAPLARGAGLDPGAPALIFPTSGSTGEPKLITYAARTMQAKAQASIGLMGAGPGEVVLIAGSHGNFGFVHHALVFLLSGGALCLLDLREAGLAALFETIRQEAVGHVRFTPSLFRAAAEQPEAGAALRGLKGVRFSGEPLLWNDVETARRILDPGCRIQNVYGSTESAIFLWTDDGVAAPDRAVAPIGRIYPLWQFAVRPDAGGDGGADAREGRLFIRARHQALGDWKAGRIDGARFPDAGDGLRLYDTGDIVRQEADGALTMLGRADRVVKVNGHRVSLAEVEAHLLAWPGCAAAAAIERRGPRGSTLAAFFTRPGAAEGEAAARAWLSARLPAAMVPARLVRVEAMPLLPGGKLDYRALAALLDDAPAHAPAAPATDDLSRLRALWNEVLQRAAADEDPDRDFSDLGGDSLRLLELRLAIERDFGRAIDAGAFLERPTLRRLAELLGIAGLAPAVAVAAGTIDFRLVRPAAGPSRGVALAMPGWSGAAAAGPWLEAEVFAGYDVWTCSVALSAANMVERGHWRGVAHAVAAAVAAGACPPPAVLFGFSIAGYGAWLVDRLLAAGDARPAAVICLDSVPMHRLSRRAGRAVRCVAGTAPGRMLLIRRAPLHPIVSPTVARLCWTAADADLHIAMVRTLEHGDMDSSAVLAAARPAIRAFLKRHPLPDAPVAADTPTGLLFDLIAGARPATADRVAQVIGEVPKSGTRLSLAAVAYLAVAHGELPAARAALMRLRRAAPPSPPLRYAMRALDDLAAGRPVPRRRVVRDPVIGSFAAVDRALASRLGDPARSRPVAAFARRVVAIAGASRWLIGQAIDPVRGTPVHRLWRALRRR